MAWIFGAVEGIVDEAVLIRLATHCGCVAETIHGRRGKAFLRERIPGYNYAAKRLPWVVLIDLDDEADCAPPFRDALLESPAPMMCLRVVVREIESWLLADRERLATFLSVSRDRIPPNPEEVANPKEYLVRVAERSRRRVIREDMIPRPGSGRSTGPAYESRLIEFVETLWRPNIALKHSDSLRRAVDCIKRVVA